MITLSLEKIEGFDWDDANNTKNELKHQVTKKECEEIFFNEPLFNNHDVSHSIVEKRLYALGITNNKRLLFISYTIRENKIRVISARDQSKKERKIFGNLL